MCFKHLNTELTIASYFNNGNVDYFSTLHSLSHFEHINLRLLAITHAI
jgi:hypothetical protein